MNRSRFNPAYLFIAPAMLHLLVLFAYPLWHTVELSFLEFNLQGNRFVGLANYSHVLHDPIFSQSLRVTLLYSVCNVLGHILIPLGLALLIFPLGSKAQSLFKGAFYLPGVVSAVVISLIWLWLFNPTDKGLLNYLLHFFGVAPLSFLGDESLALPSLIFMSVLNGLGMPLVLYLAAMTRIPPELREAARMDGASGWAEMWHVTVPLLKPVTLFLAVTGTISSLQVFSSIYLMTGGGPNFSTTTVVYRIYQVAFEFFQMGRACALAILLTAVILAASLIQFKLFKADVEY